MKTLYLARLIVLFLALGILSPNLSGQILINEYSVSNLTGFLDNYGSNEDWIELYNVGTSTINLTGFSLSDNPSQPLKWQFPAGVSLAAGGFLKIWASGRNEVTGGHYHTNFRLTQTKDEPEVIVFSNPFSSILDQVQLEITQKDHSRGRTVNGSSSWSIFTNPTPGASNNNATAYSSYSEKPQMSQPAGFYTDAISIEISANEPNTQIHYTLDGSEPILSSPVYNFPIPITQTTIVKARTISSDPMVLPGLIEFNTYFINDAHTTAILSTSSAQLDDLLNGNQSLKPFGTLEYFNKFGIRTTIGYGEFNEHGQDSWVHPQRSIDYISRDECGYNYAIRDTIISVTKRNEFQRIILRAAGDDNYPGIDTSALLRDYFVENTACKANMKLDVRKGEKGLLYVNGQYWGVYGYREKVNDHDFTQYYYNQGKYDIYFLMLWGGSWAEYGGPAAWSDWNSLHDFAKNNDMSIQENFEYVKARLDYTSLVDYILINSFVVCSDWINWNVGWWRGTNPEGDHLKWGYTLWDEDATFNHYINYTGVPGTLPTVSPCFPEGLTNDPEQHIVLLNKLRNNAEFNQYYITRYLDLYNTVFRPERMIAYLDTIETIMKPEMPRHIQRWGGSMDEWLTNVQKIRNFVTTRWNYLPTGLKACYNLNGPYEFSVDAEPAAMGHVQLNSLTLNSFPWQGSYFGGVDTKLSAIPNDINYEFDYWELSNHTALPNDTSSEITINLTTWENVVAHFKPKVYADSLVINEINYNSADDFNTEDWIEFYNPHPYQLNISNWVFKDEDDQHSFVFPEGTLIDPAGYLVLCRDTALFKPLFPEATNFIGNMDFGLSGGGELIRLYNESGALVDTVHYLDESPWPTEPDGNGPTLELIAPHLDNSLAENWMASPLHGTPGAMNSLMVGMPKLATRVKPQIKLMIYPNPVSDYAIIELNTRAYFKSAKVEIFNLFGEKVREVDEFNTNSIKINCKNLTSGIYSVRLLSDENQYARGKMIVK